MFKNKNRPHPADRQTPGSVSDILSVKSSMLEDKESWDIFDFKPSENIDECVN